MHKQIYSVQNSAIKKLLQLQEKSRLRKKEGVFVVEGKREILLALSGGYQILELYFCSSLFSSEEGAALLSKYVSEALLVEISREVYHKIAIRGSTEGVIAVAVAKELKLENLKFRNSKPLVLIAEAPEKPGNIGALLRTADAANLDAVIIADPKTDLYNPNIIRSSVGCLFTNNVGLGTTPEIISFLKQHKITVFGASLEASVPYYSINFTSGSAIVVGTEATGLSETWLKNTDRNIYIPMQGEIDSMNVSVAAGILIFEAKRQRNFE